MAGFAGFPKGTAKFLRELSQNNGKIWFDAHRGAYEANYIDPARAFVATIDPRLQKNLAKRQLRAEGQRVLVPHQPRRPLLQG